MASVKNIRLLSIFSIALVSMILIISQSPEASAGACTDEDRDGYYTVSSPSYCAEVDQRDCDDKDANIGPGNGCVDGIDVRVVIESDVKDGVVVGPDDIVVISDGVTVDGDIEVNGGTIIIGESSTIKGNLESNGGTISIEEGSVIEGNVDIKVSGASGVLEIDGAEIKGNLETNGIGTLTVTDSNINGNIYSENDIDVTITGNTVNGNIEILGPSSCSESSNDVNGNNSHCP